MSLQESGSIIFFGDSLTDNGNLFGLAQSTLPPEIYALFGGPTGAISNGPTWASYTADLLGLTEDNRAYADAEALGSRDFGDLVAANGLTDALLVAADDPILDTPIDFAAQIDAALAPDASDALVGNIAVVLIGGNDYLEPPPTPANIAAARAAITDETLAAASDLAQAGTQTVWVSELPVATFFPALEGPGSALAIATFDAHNAALADGVTELQAQGLDVEILHMGAITEAIAHDPGGFGLVAPYDQTLNESDVTQDFEADQVAFYDSVHPSTATHGIMGAFAAFEIDGGTVIENGTSEGDLYTLGADDEFLATLDGSDAVRAVGGDDILVGGTGADSLLGGVGQDMISGGTDGDFISGGHGADILGGQSGNDLILGRSGDDVLIHDGLGLDTLRGGDDDDTFIFNPVAGNDGAVIRGGSGHDTLYVIATDQSGLDIQGVEDIIFLDTLAPLTTETWFEAADLWGMV